MSHRIESLIAHAAAAAAIILLLGLSPLPAEAAAANPIAPTAPTPAPDADLDIPDRLTPAQVDQILAQLTDAQVRQLLSRKLHETAQAQAAAKGGGGGFGVLLVQIRLKLERAARELHKGSLLLAQGSGMVPGEIRQALIKATGNDGWPGVFASLGSLLAILAAGLGAHWAMRRWFAPHRERLQATPDRGFLMKLGPALTSVLLDGIALAAFALVTIGITALFFDESGAVRSFLITYLTGAMMILLAALAARFLFAPQCPALRLLPLADDTAQFLHRWSIRLAAVLGLTWLTAGLLILTGIQIEAHLVIVLATGAIAAGTLIVMIFDARPLVSRMLTGNGGENAAPAGRRGSFLDSWHIFATFYIVAVWALWAASMVARSNSAVVAAIVSVVVVVMIPICDRVTGKILTNLFHRPDAAEQRAEHRFLPVVQNVLRLILIGFAVLVILELWGLPIFGDARAGTFLLDAGVDIAAAILLAYLGWELVKVGIDRNLVPHEVGGQMVEPSDRAKTLLPLIRKVIMIVLSIMTVMIVLSALGVNIGPLLAGAGVVGLAIGFGAQALVKDIVSGIFFLIDDAFRVGEYIEMGEIRGEVEAISMRSLRLRHHRGAIHTVPFGELRSVTNYNRDWTIYKMAFRVPHDTDVDKVKKIFKQIGKEMMEDPELGAMLIEPLKSQGVQMIDDDSALIIRAKFMCKPREQFVLRREAYKRIQAAFAANGIEFARRKVEVTAASSIPGETGSEALPPGAAAAVAAEPTGA